jgi:hypothetical protein
MRHPCNLSKFLTDIDAKGQNFYGATCGESWFLWNTLGRICEKKLFAFGMSQWRFTGDEENDHFQIPNPLFDLAGITCGHFLVPFGTFFGATLLGKAVIKMHIQMIFVVITFSERHVEHLISLFTYVLIDPR